MNQQQLERKVAELERENGRLKAAIGGGLLSAAQVAERLGVSRRTLTRLVAAGQFPQPVRYNRKLVRWRLGDVSAHLGQGG